MFIWRKRWPGRVRPQPDPTGAHHLGTPRADPILHHRFGRRDNLSVAGFICYHPDGRRVRLLVGHVVGAYHTAALITVLQCLPGLVDGAPVILVRDQLPAHHSTDMKTWLAAQTGWLQVVELPGYAPTSTRSNRCGQHSNGKDLANYAATGLAIPSTGS